MLETEIPSDAVVVATLRGLGVVPAADLLAALIEADYTRRDSQRAIQRCLDRGSIRLGQNLTLEVTLAEAA